MGLALNARTGDAGADENFQIKIRRWRPMLEAAVLAGA
jgi:hypothetical protein